MSGLKAFFDTNILLYLLSAESDKANCAERLLAGRGTISVQVLNEFIAVASRKLGLSYPEIREILESIRAVCAIQPMTLETHELGLQIAEQHGFSIYDSLIIASALLAGCETLYSEDLQDGQIIERQITIKNPFQQDNKGLVISNKLK